MAVTARGRMAGQKLFDSSYAELLLKIPIAVTALFYVTGVFVQAFYLGRFNIFKFDLLKLIYVLAGFWAYFYIILPGLIILLTTLGLPFLIHQNLLRFFGAYRRTLSRFSPNVMAWEAERGLQAYLGILIVAVIVATLLLYEPFSFAGPERVVTSFRLIPGNPPTFATTSITEASPVQFFQDGLILSLGFLGCLALSIAFSLLTAKYLLRWYLRLPVLLIILGLLASITLLILDDFSGRVYEKIPSFVGGGSLRPITLVIKSTGKAVQGLSSLEAVPAATSDSTPAIDPSLPEVTHTVYCQLILETDEGYYVRSYRQTVAFFRREAVLHLIFQDPPVVIIEPTK